ncbi:MAG: glycosyltransferase family 2 protein [Saprospiraceae bacterium]|nr:glycosyltransferase family 2 protein [Saprospiraceae bacterium]
MKVSVLINNYNNGRFIRECLESIQHQVTDHEIEIIVYDDGSADHSLIEIKSFSDVQLINRPHYGKTPMLNQAHAIETSLEYSTGELILLLDGDDYFLPHKVETVVQEYLQDPYDLLAHSYYPEKPLIPDVNIADLTSRFIVGYIATTSCLVVHRDFISSVFPLDRRFARIWLDTRLHIQSILRGKRKIIQTPLTFYRRHQDANSIKQSFLQRKLLVWETGRYFNYYSPDKMNWSKILSYKFLSNLGGWSRI